MILYAKDENSNIKNAIYSYRSNPTGHPSSIIEIDLDYTRADVSSSFASVSRRNVTSQRTLIVTRDRQLQRCIVNYRNSDKFVSSFSLTLIDSSRGQMVTVISLNVKPLLVLYAAQVNMATVRVNVQCCHVGYEYSNVTGRCEFMYSENNHLILRQDNLNNSYIYIQVMCDV